MENFWEIENVWFDLLLLVAAALAVWVLHHFLFYFLKKGGLFRKNGKMDTLRHHLYYPVLVLLIFIALLVIYPALDGLDGYITDTVHHVISIVGIITVAWLLVRLIRAGRIIIMRKYDIKAEDNFEARKAYTQFHIIENILVFLVIIVSVGIILMTFDPIRKIGLSLLTSAGIAGIILGFAAQKLIATILAGVQIAFTQPIRIDDVVIVEGEWGRIEEINLTYVVVLIWDQRRLVVPTTYFIENAFQNWTRTSSEILGTVFIYTDYDVPVDALRKELKRLVKSNEKWDKRVCVLQVTDVKERTVELRALVSAADAGETFDLRVFVREKLVEFLKENYPNSLPRTRVRMEEESAGVMSDE